MLAELACAATLAPAYKPSLFRKVVPQTDKPATVIFVACGGFKVSMKDMEEYKQVVATSSADWDVVVNGESFTVSKAE